MSSNDEFEGIKFTWRIDNFSYSRGGSLQSPSFGSNPEVWEVIVFSNDDYVSLSLQNSIFTDYNFRCAFALLDSHDIPLLWKETKTDNSSSCVNFSPFIEMDMLSSNKSNFLPNDTLTIQCCIWQVQKKFTPLLRFVHTRIKPTSRSSIDIMFTVDGIGVHSLQPFQSLEFCKAINDDESLTIELRLNNDNEFQVKLKTHFKSIQRIHAKIKIALLDTSGRRNEFAICENQFQRLDHMRDFDTKTLRNEYGTKITKNMLMCFSNEILFADKLSLQFACILTEKVVFKRRVPRRITDVCGITEPSIHQPTKAEIHQPIEQHSSNTLSQSLQEVLNEGSDFNLRIGDKVFPVHKDIIGMRSQVFRAMFTTGMKEKEDNSVDIKDVDEDTLQRMLQFLYLDRLDEGMGWDSAFNLYAAADKYALETLKQKCSGILESSLCVSGVLEVLWLADMHQNEGLKSAAMGFISFNDKDIIGTERWLVFEDENSKLALETLRTLYMKKMNG